MLDFKKVFALCLMTASLSLSTVALAKPAIQPLGPNIADTQSQFYDFQIKKFKSKDQKRTYKVWLAIPKLNKKTQQAVLFAVDGNAFIDRLKEPMLAKMSENNPLVLVVIGYDSDLPFVAQSRSLDYTPADASGKIQPDPRSLDRLSGGSVDFRNVVLEQIAPWVEEQVKVDKKRIGIWGHSYGGLFVLDTMMHSDYFSHYFAASPSLAWAENRALNQVLKSQVSNAQNKQLLLMEGDVIVKAGENVSPNFDQQSMLNNRKVAHHFEAQNLKSKFMIYPNQSHGAMFNVAMLETLFTYF